MGVVLALDLVVVVAGDGFSLFAAFVVQLDLAAVAVRRGAEGGLERLAAATRTGVVGERMALGAENTLGRIKLI